MGVGIIGVSSGAAEALPFGAGALITSGFVNGAAYDYTASVGVGRYIIEGATQDGSSPVIAYAPNSNTVAIAYPGKSAILNVTQSETVIKLSAIPTIASVAGVGVLSPNNSHYRNIAGAENTNGSIIVFSMSMFTGSYWDAYVYASNDYGVNWYQVLSRTGNSDAPRPIKFMPGNGGYFILGLGDNWVWRSTDGINWSQREGLGGNIHDFYDDGNGVVYAASAGGIYRSVDHGLAWSQVYSNGEIYSISKIDSSGQLVGIRGNTIVYSTSGNSGTWTQNSYANYYNIQTNTGSFNSGLAKLKNYLVTTVDYFPSSELTGAGYSIIGSGGATISSSYQGEITQKTQNANFDGPENTHMVTNRENRGFVLSIGAISGSVYFSVDGLSWQKLGYLPGSTNRHRYITNLQAPEIVNGNLFVSTNVTGRHTKYNNKFAYKIYASVI